MPCVKNKQVSKIQLKATTYRFRFVCNFLCIKTVLVDITRTQRSLLIIIKNTLVYLFRNRKSDESDWSDDSSTVICGTCDLQTSVKHIICRESPLFDKEITLYEKGVSEKVCSVIWEITQTVIKQSFLNNIRNIL